MKEKPKKESKKKKFDEPKEVELTPKQLKEKRREEARARAAESRKIVAAGVVSWTGKLPAQLLNEYCQKLKWERVDYPIKGSGEAFTASVIVAKQNAKTKQVDRVRLDPPLDIVKPQPTPLEARHLAATYALHRISSHKNWKMMLPPMHRDLWVQFDEIKAKAPEKDSWKWKEDPFQAEVDRKQAIKEYKEQAERNREKQKEHSVISAIRNTVAQESNERKESVQPQKRVKFNSPLIMSKSMRELVETTIRENGGFEFSTDHALDRKSPLYKSICSTLSKLGFEKAQIEEALEYSCTLSDALAWLLIHVPEDDLPKMFMPTALANTARVSSALSIENGIAKIRQYGFSEDVARSAIVQHGSVAGAMVWLTHRLVEAAGDDETQEEIWEEEMESIDAVFGDKFKRIDDVTCEIKLEGELLATFYRAKSYPSVIPGIGILSTSSKSVPKYVLLDAIKRAAEYAQDLIGDFMILSIANWVEENFESVLKNPSKLSRISSGVSGTIEHPEALPAKKSKAYSGPRWKPLDSALLKSEHQQRFNTSGGLDMMKSRQSLPAWKKRAEIVDVINNNQVTLITGETGSGKSTQVVQFVLDNMLDKNDGGKAHIVCTQPRRISAIGVAQRVADERLVSVGGEVGYIIRGENKVSPSTQIKFLTSGVLLRMIQSDPTMLDSFTHIVVDEVHERSLDSDFLLILLKRICARRKSLKVVLMSATVDPALFVNYFKKVSGTVGYAHIEGRTFPVEKHYLNDIIVQTKYVPSDLERSGATSDDVGQIITSMRDGVDFELVASLVEYIHGSVLKKQAGSILIFMSGVAEIDRTIRALERHPASSEFWTLPLHASLAPADQRLVFNKPPKGKRKIIVCTNVAETSITISDALAVIDSGRVKETVYDPSSNVIKLVDNWTSQASTTQRMGRAGRVQAGFCYKLFTAQIETEKMIPRPTPEILRAPLESLYLSIKSMGINDVEKFLAGALDSPDATALETARTSLVRYGALDTEENSLTPLGQHMSLIPADPKTAKLIVLAAIFGCLPVGLTIASIIAGKPPFVSPREKRDAAKSAQLAFNQDGQGDLIAQVQAYDQWLANQKSMSRGQLKTWCADNFISNQACRDILSTRRQFLSNLAQTGFVGTDREDRLPKEYTAYNGDIKLVRAVLGASLTPSLAEIVLPDKVFKTISAGTVEVDPEAQKIRYFTPAGNRVFVHPGSLMFGINKFVDDARYLSFASSIVSSKHFVSTVTPLSLYGLIFFSNQIEVDPLGAGVVIDQWTGLKCWPRVGLLVQFLKKIFSELLGRKFADPSIDMSVHPVVRVVHQLIDSDGKGNL